MDQKQAIIIGAGPAGLTAAYELISKTDIHPVIYEATESIGGISQTIDYKGNRMDIGGHRFFSKSDNIMKWWQEILPVQGAPSRDDILLGRNISVSEEVDAPDPEETDKVMLMRQRLSRILFLRKFFDYPISLNLRLVRNLGIIRTVKIGMSYIQARLFPIKHEKSLEDFFINRFGRELYLTFFKDYTEKVWGVPCKEIDPTWGAQRIQGLSISKAILHAIKSAIATDSSLAQKNTETTLIENFLYPKFGPGQMWERVAKIIVERGGELYLGHQVIGLEQQGDRVFRTKIRNMNTGEVTYNKGTFFLSTMAVKDLIECLGERVPKSVRSVAQGLLYRDFITVGLLLKELRMKNNSGIRTIGDIIPDNWIYVQENDVKLGRIQIFNNWSPYMVKNENTVWLGLEYFCNEGDQLWRKTDLEFSEFAIDELEKVRMINRGDVLDYVVVRILKAYPSYFGSYSEFYKIRQYTDQISNLFLIGRNGMHRYNNQDHSMLTAMKAVENIIENRDNDDNIWTVNEEEEYHEAK